MSNSNNNESAEMNNTNNHNRRAVLAGAAGLLSISIAGCSSNTSESQPESETTGRQTPEEFIREYTNAMKNGNRQKLNSMIMDNSSADKIDADLAESYRNQEITLDNITVIEQSEDQAVVEVTRSFTIPDLGTSTPTAQKTLEMTDDGWKITDVEIV